MTLPHELLTRLAPIIGAFLLVIAADRVGDTGPLGVAAAAAIIFGGVAAVGWMCRK